MNVNFDVNLCQFFLTKIRSCRATKIIKNRGKILFCSNEMQHTALVGRTKILSLAIIRETRGFEDRGRARSVIAILSARAKVSDFKDDFFMGVLGLEQQLG